ncbi:hypothetical protein ACFQS7_27890 [Dankookia sp. GCM10030260]|uniref:hypothetical protein n=1 Tax=Dankookia sp. GCM10030260 TaxID=3273390 RepID=UPI00360A4100
MILKIWSDLVGFREAVFSPGMNVVLADRGKDSDENESTNGLGKTTLLRIMHFCFGSDFSREKVLNHPDLIGTSFGIDFQLNGNVIRVMRNTRTPKRVAVTASFLEGIPVDQTKTSAELAEIDIDDWRMVLSARLTPDSRVSEGNRKFAPSFREVSLYYIRLGKDAFVDPQIAFRAESGASKRLAVSYLMGLNWDAQRSLQEVLLARANVTDALKALKEADSATNERSIGELEAERVVLEDAIKQRQKAVQNFQVRDDYADLETRLTLIDRKLHDLINDNHSDKKLLEY